MRFPKRLAIGLLSAGLVVGWGIPVRGEDRAPTERGERPRGQAGDRGGPGRGRIEPPRIAERIQERLNELNLSAEQKTKIKTIIDKAQKDVEALQSSKDLEPRQRMEKMREIMRPLFEEISGVLDETQREKLREGMRERRGPRGEARFGPPGRPEGPGPDGPVGPDRPQGRRGPDGPAGPGGNRPPDPLAMVQRLRDNVLKLELNEEQKNNVETLLSETEKKLSDLRTEMEKMQAEARGKLREAMESNRDRLNEILTEEQKQKLRELMPPPPPRPGDGEGRPRGGDRDGRRGRPA